MTTKTKLTPFFIYISKDWWNSNSFSSYYRMWNVVVHDWLYAYVYRDVLHIAGSRYRFFAASG